MTKLRDKIADMLTDADTSYAKSGDAPSANELADAILALPEIAQALGHSDLLARAVLQNQQQDEEMDKLQKKLAEVEAERAELAARNVDLGRAVAYGTQRFTKAEAAEAKLAEVLERFAEGRGDREEALATLEDKPAQR